MKTRKVLAIIFALILVPALFAGCGSSEPAAATPPPTSQPSSSSSSTPATTAPAASGQTGSEPTDTGSDWPDGPPLVIGHILDLTGAESSSGLLCQRSFNFAVEALGGKFAGREIQIIEGDAGGNAGTALEWAKRMVEEYHVEAIFGPTQMGEKTQVASYVAEAGVPLVLYNPTPPNLLASENPWLVGVGGSSAQSPSVMADYSYNVLGIRKVHTIYMDNAGGMAFIKPFVSAFEALGGTIVSAQGCPVPTADFAPYFANMTDDADAIVSWTSGSDAINLLTAWYDAGLSDKLPIVAPFNAGFLDYHVMEAIDGRNPAITAAIEGTYVPIAYVYNTGTPENEEFVSMWREKFGEVPPGGNLPGDIFQSVLVFKTAVEDLGGTTTPETLLNALFSVDITGPVGHVNFNNAQVATRDIHIVQVTRLEDKSFNYSIVTTYKDVSPSGYGS